MSSDLINTISFVAAVASVILAVVAIWISFVFYKMGMTASEKADKSAQEIHESVIKLEQLFNTMYNDTFSMMKDTVSNMQKHMWPDKLSDVTATENAVQDKTDKRIEELKQQMNKELASFLAQQKSGDGQLEALSKNLAPIINRAITESSKVTSETREETIREAIMTVIADLASNGIFTIAADELVGRIDKKYALSFGDTLNTFIALRDEGLISWSGPNYVLSSTRININPDVLKKASIKK